MNGPLTGAQPGSRAFEEPFILVALMHSTRLIRAFAAFVLFFCLMSCRESGKPQALSDDQSGARLAVPAGFTVGPISKDDTKTNAVMKLQASDLRREIGVGVISEAKMDLADVHSISEYIDVTSTRRSTSLKDISATPPTRKTCQGNPCAQMSFTASSQHARIAYDVLYVETPSYFHQVLAWTSPSKLAANRETMRSILDSFEPEGAKAKAKPL